MLSLGKITLFPLSRTTEKLFIVIHVHVYDKWEDIFLDR